MKTIDLSCIVGKPVLCKLKRENGVEGVGFLIDIRKLSHSHLYIDQSGEKWDRAELLKDYWQVNTGELKLPAGIEVFLKADYGVIQSEILKEKELGNRHKMFQVIGIAGGYQYAWS